MQFNFLGGPIQTLQSTSNILLESERIFAEGKAAGARERKEGKIIYNPYTGAAATHWEDGHLQDWIDYCEGK